MKDIYSNGNLLYACHFPGGGKQKYLDKFGYNVNRIFTISDDISIISLMNTECKEKSLLDKQLAHNSIKYFNSKLALNTPSSLWNNSLRAKMIVDLLKEIKTKYVLILDGNDVLITNNLDDDFIKKFESLNCSVLFNFTNTLSPGNLNAGVCFGVREDLLKIYSELANKVKFFKIVEYDDQACLTNICKNKDFVKLDEENLLFGCFHKQFKDNSLNYEIKNEIVEDENSINIREWRNDL